MNDKERDRLEAAFKREFGELHRATMDLFRDPACLAMPHPARVKANAGCHPRFAPYGIVGYEHADKLVGMLKSGMTTAEIWHSLDMLRLSEFARYMYLNASHLDGGYNGGAAGATFQAMRFYYNDGAMFTIDDDLLEMLQQTDIDLDILVSDIKLPFPNVYIELGRSRKPDAGKLTMYNPISGQHVLEGAYVSMTHHSRGTHNLEITMTGSPVGKSNLGDDAVEWVSMELSLGHTVSQALHYAYCHGQRLFDGSGSETTIEMPDSRQLEELERACSARLELIIKALLYLGLPSVRKEVCKDHTEAKKASMRAMSTAHKRKAARAMAKSYDTVLVLPPVTASTEEGRESKGQASARSMRSHWRRGHFRTQRFGIGLTERRTIWIAPVLVNPAQMGAVTPKHYVAKI